CPPPHLPPSPPAQPRHFPRPFHFALVDVICERRRPRALPGLLRSLGKRTSATRHRDVVASAAAHDGRSEPKARSRRPTRSIRRLRNLMLGHTMILVARRPA